MTDVYGIQINGNNGQLIIDGAPTSNTEFLSAGTVNTSFGTAGTAAYNPLTQFLFMQLQVGSGTQTLKASSPNNIYPSFTFHQPTRHFIVTKSSAASATSEGYGIQINNNSGTQLFSSRNVVRGFNIIRVFDHFSLAHGDNLHTDTDISNIFVSAPFMLGSPQNASGTIGCFDFTATSINFNSRIVVNAFGTSTIPIPNIGSIAVAELKV